MASIDDISLLLKSQLGLKTGAIDSSDLKFKIDDFMAINEIDSFDYLLDILKSKPNLFMVFTDTILDKSSWFFRDEEVYKAMVDYLKSTGKNEESNKIRILSVGCAGGEETYSIVIALIEAGFNPNHFTIEGIDISPDAIEIARQAIYNDSSFKNVASLYKEKYFQMAEDLFILNPKIAQFVNFYKVNFIEGNFFNGRKKYDIIIAKNIFNSKSIEATNKLLDNITSVLNDTGLLITTENEMEFIPNSQFMKSEFGESSFTKVNVDTQVNEANTKHSKSRKDRVRKLSNILRFKIKSENGEFDEQDKFDLLNSETDTIIKVKQYIKENQFEKALKAVSKLLKAEINNPEIYYLIGKIYELKNDLVKAEDFYHKALYIEPNHYDTLVKLILLFENKGWTDKADLLKRRIEKITGMQ